MAKFFVTNNEEWYEQTKKRISKSDYSMAFDYAKDGVYALTTHKLKISNSNAYEDANGDFVIATGTAIYKESLDYSLLQDDCKRQDMLQGGAESIRNNTIGQYAYALKINDAIYVFGDAFGSYNIYYYQKDGYYYITNFLYDMAIVLRDQISINELNVLEHSVQCGILNGDTFFTEIKRLRGDECIKIEHDQLNVCPLYVEWEMLSGDERKNAQLFADRLKNTAEIISNVIGPPTICMTGGLDSRMSLAAYLCTGAEPNLLWGESNTQLASPEPSDKQIVEDFAEKYNLKKQLVKWDTTHPDKDWEKYLNRYGFLYNVWGAAEDVMNSFENEKFMTCGYGGELYRNLSLTENRDGDITIDDLMGEYYMRHGHVDLNREEELREQIKSKLIKIANKHGLDVMRLKPEDITYFFIEYRSVADTITLNLLNCIGYSNLLLMEKDVVKYCRVPNSWMNNSRYMLETLYILFPSILEVPIFSHRSICRFDSKNMKLYTGVDINRSQWVLTLKQIYKKVGGILKPLRNLYKKMEKKQDTDRPLAKKLEVVYSKPTFNAISLNPDFNGTNLEYEWAQNIYALKSIYE